jgi:protein-S-isoprenylcysteine O-methyltransferase Ste14
VRLSRTASELRPDTVHAAARWLAAPVVVVVGDSMETKAIYGKAIVQLLVSSLLAAVCLFGVAGTFRWWNAWALLAVGLLISVLAGSLLCQSPELLKERMTARKQAKWWDKALVPLLGAVLPLLMIILAGLDRRYAWTRSLTTAGALAGLLVALAGVAVTYWAMRSNPFFSSHVRIQTDRGHTVVSRGAYGHIRHPGYAGSILYNLGSPLLLGSLVALWAGLALLFVLVLRTALEDRTLQSELPGYREYAARVRYRLVPFVW